MEVSQQLYREEDTLEISIPCLRRKVGILTESLYFESLMLVNHLCPFACLKVICPCVKHFWSTSSGKFAIHVKDSCCLLSLTLANEGRTEVLGMVKKSRDIIYVTLSTFLALSIVPSHIHEELDRIFHWLEVAYIENPEFLDAVLVCERELFPHILDRSYVESFGITRSTYIVNVVVESPTALTLTFLHGRYTTYVTPVVITEENCYIIRHTHTIVIVVEHLLIESPYLWNILGSLATSLADELTLIGNNTFHEFQISVLAHSHVAITTHTDSDNILCMLITLYATIPEFVKIILVGSIVPFMITFILAFLLTCSQIL